MFAINWEYFSTRTGRRFGHQRFDVLLRDLRLDLAVVGIGVTVVAAPREWAHTTWLRLRALTGDTGAMRELGPEA